MCHQVQKINYRIFFPQYVPLPLFFAEDKLSFYKVMSDTQGYKHIHYVKDVSMFADAQKTCGRHGVYVHACHIH